MTVESPKLGLQQLTKAESIAAKDEAIVLAARKHFLRIGFAGASMDAIAASAAVSVKTVYSHFANKDELFRKVMIGACTDNLFAGATPTEEALTKRFPWFSDATQQGVFEAGKEYLKHLLSEDQLALYRAVTRDTNRFPELGRQYHKEIARGRTGILAAYLARTSRTQLRVERDELQDAAVYEGLLRATIFEEALHGLVKVRPALVESHALKAASVFWKLFASSNE